MFKIKTLVEFFDICQIENVIAGIKLKPEKIIFVGFKKVMSLARCEAIREFFKKRNPKLEISFEIVGRYDFNELVNKLNYVIDNNEDCFFDLTGGKEIVLTAAGVVAAKRNIPLFQLDVTSGRFTSLLNCPDIEGGEPMLMTIDEAVELNGCSVIRNSECEFKWDFNDEFRKDIEVIWEISKAEPAEWNKQINYLEALSDETNLTVKGSLNIFKGKAKEEIFNKRIMDSLVRAGLISDYMVNDSFVSLKYKNLQVKKCLTKAGNILELYGYLILYEINEEEKGFYDDIDIGIFIDWDKEHSEGYSHKAETTNEIDLMVMRDLVPVFISCKNGEVHKEALYELETVANRFGGKYAKKVLFATYINRSKKGLSYILKRAEDMNIRVIYQVFDKTKEMLKEEVKKVVK